MTCGYCRFQSCPRMRSLGCGLRTSQQGFERREFDRLDDVEIEPCLLRAASVFVLSPARESDKNHVPTPRLLTNAPGDIVAVQLGEADVQEHKLGVERLRDC